MPFVKYVGKYNDIQLNREIPDIDFLCDCPMSRGAMEFHAVTSGELTDVDSPELLHIRRHAFLYHD